MAPRPFVAPARSDRPYFSHHVSRISRAQFQFSKEWSQKGEPALAVLAFEKALEAFGRQKEVKEAD